jgi:hypothetical protein
VRRVYRIWWMSIGLLLWYDGDANGTTGMPSYRRMLVDPRQTDAASVNAAFCHG